MQILLVGFVLASVLCTVSTLGLPGEDCNTPDDCNDAGTTCTNGKCLCWLGQGGGREEAWACNVDSFCAESFPDHLCRISTGCGRFNSRIGWCTPRRAIRQPPAVVAPPAPEVAPAPVRVQVQAAPVKAAPVIAPEVAKPMPPPMPAAEIKVQKVAVAQEQAPIASPMRAAFKNNRDSVGGSHGGGYYSR